MAALRTIALVALVALVACERSSGGAGSAAPLAYDPVALRKIVQDLAGGHVFVVKVHGAFAEYRDVARVAAAIDPVVVAATPSLITEAWIRHDTVELPTIAKAMTLDRMQRVVAPHVARGALPADDRELAIVVGEFQAIALHVDVGDRVELRVASDERGSAIERGATATARVAAVMHTDLAEYDARFVVGSFVPVQRWLARGDTALAVELELRDDTAARRIAKALAAKLGDGYAVQDWCELNKALLGCAWRE